MTEIKKLEKQLREAKARAKAKKKNAPKVEYILAKELQEEYLSIVTILGVLMNKEENCYVPNENKFYKVLYKKCKEANLLPSKIKTVLELLKNITADEDEEFFNHDDWIVPFTNVYYNAKGNKFITAFQDEKKFFYQIPHPYLKDFKGTQMKDGTYKMCPIFNGMLEKYLVKQKNVNECIVDDIFEIMGYCMTMTVSLKKAIYIFGPTQTGKTTFQTILLHIIGDKNTSNISLWRMQKDQFGTDGLQLKILNTIGETRSGKLKDLSYFKQIAGGDKYIAVEPKGFMKGRFVNAVKLLFLGNRLPDLVDRNDQAFYDRWILINFARQFKVSREKYSGLVIDNPDEVQGIIHKCIEGLERLRKRGNFRPELIENNKHIWNYNSDNFYRFLHDRCVIEWGESVVNSNLYRAYVRYVVDNELGEVISEIALTRELKKYKIFLESHYEDKNRIFEYNGIRLKTDEEEKQQEKEVIEKMEIGKIQTKEELEFDYEIEYDKYEEELREAYDNAVYEEQSLGNTMYEALTPADQALIDFEDESPQEESDYNYKREQKSELEKAHDRYVRSHGGED